MQYADRLAFAAKTSPSPGTSCLATVNGCSVAQKDPSVNVQLTNGLVCDGDDSSAGLNSKTIADLTSLDSSTRHALCDDELFRDVEDHKLETSLNLSDTYAAVGVSDGTLVMATPSLSKSPSNADAKSGQSSIMSANDKNKEQIAVSDRSVETDMLARPSNGGVVNEHQTKSVVGAESKDTSVPIVSATAGLDSHANMTSFVSSINGNSESHGTIVGKSSSKLVSGLSGSISQCSLRSPASTSSRDVVLQSANVTRIADSQSFTTTSSPISSPAAIASSVHSFSLPNVKTITLYTIASSPHKNTAVTAGQVNSRPLSSPLYASPSQATTKVGAVREAEVTTSTALSSCTASPSSTCITACRVTPIPQYALGSQPPLDSTIDVSGREVTKESTVADCLLTSDSNSVNSFTNQCLEDPVSEALSINARPKSFGECMTSSSAMTSVHASGSSGLLLTSKKQDYTEDRLSIGSLDIKQPHLRRSDRHSVSSITSETRFCSGPSQLSDMPPFLAVDRGISLGQGIEKLLDRTALSSGRNRSGYDTGTGVVRSSWSQENYFDHSSLTCVDIELDDDDDLASSVDVLHYQDGSTSSNISLSGQLPNHSWTEDDVDDAITVSDLTSGKLRSWAPLTSDVFSEISSLSSNATETKPANTVPAIIDYKLKAPAVGVALAVDSDDVVRGFSSSEPHCRANDKNTTNIGPLDSASSPDTNNAVSNFALPILATRPTAKDVDRPSAARLAKRLFYLQGFRKTDVLRHLTKRNSFSQLVGEEFTKFFDFTNETLDVALRQFVKCLAVTSDLQDRDQLLLHFAHRYYGCNSGSFKSEECCHTLACAMVLLNTDLQSLGRSMTLLEFINNLAELNDGENFPEDLLTSLYESIRDEPLQFDRDETEISSVTFVSAAPVIASSPPTILAAQARLAVPGLSNPLFEIHTDCDNVKEYKKGYVMRKCCVEPDGRKTALGKRGWKMFYMTLRDLTLCLYNDEQSYKRATHCSNIIRVHHALATKAGDYVKKKHVFRMQTADVAQYLIQTSDSRECQEWIDTINFIAASYSAPCHFSPISPAGSGSQKRFQRPLLPSAYTTLKLRDQISHQEKMVAQFERDLLEHRKDPPEKGARSRIIHEYCKKETFLKFELKRYKTYVRLLQYKLAAFSELEPSLAETIIGEVEEPSTSPSPETANLEFSLGVAVDVTGQGFDGVTSAADGTLDTVHEV